MPIVIFFLLLNIIFCVNIDKYYRNQFTNDTRDPHLKLSKKSNKTDIPYILSSQNIPRNATLLTINKTQMLISCSKFPYDEVLHQYINQYLERKR